MRIIKYYEHSVNTGEVVPLRLSALEEIIADSVCNLLNNPYSEYGNNVIEIEFRRADVKYVYCNRRREADFALALHRNTGQIDDIFVTINYNTNELISIESNVGSAFNHSLFKGLSERLMKNEKEIKGQLNEWLKEAAKPKIWVGSAPVYSEIKEKFRKFIKGEQKAIWNAYIPDTIKRYIENDPVIMSKNYISEEEKGMITPNFVRHSQAIDDCIKTLMNKFYCYRTANVIYCSSHAEHAKEQDTVQCNFKVYCTQNENDGPMLQKICIRCCPYCYDIHILDVEVESINCLKWYTGETNHDLREFIFKSLKAQFNNKKENEDMDKKCINRANVYKTMTDDQKIVMQDAIANAVESAIKDCHMEYEKALKALRLKIENYNGLINSIYGSDGMLSKLNKLKNSLEVQKIIINEPAMIVFWKDGTKTVVTATDEAFDEEKGLAMAYAKKWLGNNYAAGGRFKAKLKHSERVKRKEETAENDVSKIPICKEIMDEAIRRVKAEMEANAAKEPTEKPAAKKPTKEKPVTKTSWIKSMMEEGFTRSEATKAWEKKH